MQLSVDVAAEVAADELERELLRRGVGQPDDEAGGEELAQPVEVLEVRVGEDLVTLGQLLALELDPFFRAEDVLEALQRAEAELALAVELGGQVEALGDLGDPDRVVVAVGVLSTLAVRVLFLVGVEGEDALDAVAERALEQSGRVAVIPFVQERRLRRQHPPAVL